MRNMRTTISPFLHRFEEFLASDKKASSAVVVEDEVTFVGAVYKSILLDLTGDNRNRLTRYTKVRDETSDDE